LIYIALLAALKPFLYILSFFRVKATKSLVIQSAKIGDYINSTVMFEALGACDVAIENANIELAKHDTRIEHIWVLDAYKRTLAGRLAVGFDIFWQNYKTIYVLTPNNLNLFLALMGHTEVSTFQHYKSGKTAKMLLSFCQKVANHTKEDLTLNTYLKLIDSNLDYTKINKNPISHKDPSPLPASLQSDKKKVGIALSAGNKIKELSVTEWEKIFEILDKYGCEIHIFGVASEKKLLFTIMHKIKISRANIVSHLGTLPLDMLPIAISKMNLFIASDTAGVYIADSYDIPIIVFAGPCYMKEQRPIGEKVLIVDSNAHCVPFSFIFDAPYHKKCDGLYDTTQEQSAKIEKFIQENLG